MTDSNKPADERLLELFRQTIQDADLTVTSRDISPSFGDVALTLSGGDIDVRLTSDRGTYSAEIRPSLAGAEWFDLPLLQMLLTRTDTLDGVPIESQAGFLHENIAEVRSALASDRWPATRQQLQDLELRRVAKRFGPV
jgi:hypothetical protein